MYTTRVYSLNFYHHNTAPRGALRELLRERAPLGEGGGLSKSAPLGERAAQGALAVRGTRRSGSARGSGNPLEHSVRQQALVQELEHRPAAEVLHVFLLEVEPRTSRKVLSSAHHEDATVRAILLVRRLATLPHNLSPP